MKCCAFRFLYPSASHVETALERKKEMRRKMRMTVIGMKFNQAEKKNVACDVISPRGTNPQPPPLRNCT
jgi:hypothetical protein